jgi:nucleoside-triphosphatase THEP1
MPKTIYIFAGSVQSGKTTSLLNWARTLNDVSGILTPVVEGRRIFLNLENGERFPMEAEVTEMDAVIVGRFSFSPSSFQYAIDILGQASKKTAGWVVVDEIGPLELRGEGFASITRRLIESDNQYSLLLVVRDGLVKKVRTTFDLLSEEVRLVTIPPMLG